jgi:hypothetical protein
MARHVRMKRSVNSAAKFIKQHKADKVYKRRKSDVNREAKLV